MRQSQLQSASVHRSGLDSSNTMDSEADLSHGHHSSNDANETVESGKFCDCQKSSNSVNVQTGTPSHRYFRAALDQQTCKKDRLTDTASLAECHTRPRRLTTAAKGHYTTKAFITHEWSAGATNPMRRKSLGGKMARRGSKRRHGKNNTS